jgi:drug/metabolite transporter (DMT)-like permease
MYLFRGIAQKVFSTLFFTIMAICIKAASERVPAGEAVFFRSFFALPVILAWLVWTRELGSGFKTRHPMGHVWRGLIGTMAMALNFAALGLLPLPEATTLFYTAPLFIVVLAAVFLGEEVRIFRISAIFAGLAGVGVVLAPRLSIMEAGTATSLATIGAFLALLGAVCAAVAQVLVRSLVSTEKTGTIVMYFTITSATVSLATLPFGWVVPTDGEAALLVGSGLFGGVGQILLTTAYRNAPVSVVAPFEYVSMVFALTFGYLLFDEVPTLPMLIGAALIVASGLFIIWREHRLGIARAAARAHVPRP